MKILHLSDWHTTPGIAVVKLQEIPEVNCQAIVITGDMWMDGVVEWQKEAWKFLVKAIKERWPGRPVVVVYGNHDKYTGPIRGAKVFNKGAHNYTANGVKFTGLYVPVQRSPHAEIMPEVQWFTKEIKKLDSLADVMLCHYPANYLPGVEDWVKADENRYPLAYLNGHIHHDFGVATQDNKLFSNASQGYTVVDAY